MPRTPDPKKAHLELHGGSYRVVVAVPPPLRPALGKSKLVQNLGTDSLRLANLMKRPHVERFRRLIEAQAGFAGASGPDMAVALELAKVAADLRRNGSDAEWEEFARAVDERRAEIRYEGSRVVSFDDPDDGQFEAVVGRPAQIAKADMFAAIAHGRATPVDVFHANYREQLHVKSRTRADDERAMKLLRVWCERNGIPFTLEEIGEKTAHAFADALPATTGLSPVTCAKYIGRLAGYWQWMLPRVDAVSSNPFKGITIRAPRPRHDERERAFTEREVAALLGGPATQQMHDLMRIGALTGARLDAIVDLSVSDVSGGCFLFKPQKREESPRFVPIHPELREIVARRTAGRKPSDEFFPEWPPVRKAGSARERSFKTSNHFTDYRRSVGVDQVVPGKRRSLVNFHSFRRWFISRLEQAGVAAELIAALVGHKRGSVTFDVYSEGPAMRSARRAIGKLSLPPIDGRPIRESAGLIPRGTFTEARQQRKPGKLGHADGQH